MPERPDKPDLDRSTTRWVYAGLILLGLFVAVFPIYRVYEPGRRAEARANQTAYLAAQGSDIFQANCTGCHGGGGRGGIGPALGAREFLQSVTDAQIAQLISTGVPGTEMVSFSNDYGGPLSSEEIQAITVYLRSLEPNAFSNPLWRTPLAAQDLYGQDLFTMACARCHGVDRKGLQGGGPDISPGSLAMQETDQWLTDRITNGYHGMPRWGNVLTAEQIQLIVSYLRGVNTNTTTTSAPGS